MLHACGEYSLMDIFSLRLSRQRIVVHKNPEKSTRYISRVLSYINGLPPVLMWCVILISEITSLFTSDARPESRSASTVEERCLPILSAAKNMYRGLWYSFAYMGSIFSAT